MIERVLITGGSGFLGQALGLKFRSEGHEVLLGARSQIPLIEAGARTACRVKPLDVCSAESVEDVFCAFRPSVVIHAAAAKHVSVSELEPLECIDVNVRGSQNIARAAVRHGCKVVIGVSTDKASAPATTYGLSKALMERCFAALDTNEGTRFSLLRLGNLAWSPGSVFRIWRDMQKRGEVIRSTGPNMRRFFMTVDQATEIISDQLKNIESLAGQVFVPRLKAAQVSEILGVWTGLFGGAWQEARQRPGDCDDQWLVASSELCYTRPYRVTGLDGFVIDHFNSSRSVLPEEISTRNASRFTLDEIAALISPELLVAGGADMEPAIAPGGGGAVHDKGAKTS